jgi:RHS repeat-associated protein
LTFFPFGDRRFSQGTLGTDRLFTGQRLDDTGLYYYGERYYDAAIGRFISADTVVSQPYNPQSLNRYSYCLNNPLKYTDPSGHVNVISDDGGWDDGTPTVVVVIPIIQSGGIGTGFGDIPDFDNEPDLPLQVEAGTLEGLGASWAVLSRYPDIEMTNTAVIDTTAGTGGGRIISIEGPHPGANEWHFNADTGPLKGLNHTDMPIYGEGVKLIGKAFVVVGLVVDTADLVTSAQADNWQFGTNTKQSIGRVAGGWTGAIVGASIGTAICPVIGTFIGGVIGGIAGRYGGQAIARKL